jgi:hypothetical protein
VIIRFSALTTSRSSQFERTQLATFLRRADVGVPMVLGLAVSNTHWRLQEMLADEAPNNQAPKGRGDRL